MDYEKKYKDALIRAKAMIKIAANQDEAIGFANTIFPELKVSEEERIRKEMIDYLNREITFSNFGGDVATFREWIAWLEKQGEPQPYKGNSDTMRKNLIKAFKSVGGKHWGGFDVRDILHWLESKDAIELEKQDELKEKPTKDQVWDYCDKISREWYQITMDKWETLTDEEKDKYNQFIGFNDFSDMLMNITAGALFQLRDTGKLEYEEGSLLLERPDEKTHPILSNSSNTGKNEQNTAGKIEPWFRVGDWIVYETEGWREVLQIETIDVHYTFTNGSSSSFDEEQNMRLWTIQDAKDGDVLTYRLDNGKVLIMIYEGLGKSFDGQVNIHALLDGDDYFSESAACVCCKFMELLTPATKEQRELLFWKMHKAGYEWNADEKTLVMIGIDNDEEDERYEELMEDDETSIKQNPSWSKEDEEMFNGCLIDLRYLVDNGRKCNKELYLNEIKWLKGIKDRVQPHWKPTDEQMEDLKYAINMVDKCCEDSLQSLYNDLKKL